MAKWNTDRIMGDLHLFSEVTSGTLIRIVDTTLGVFETADWTPWLPKGTRGIYMKIDARGFDAGDAFICVLRDYGSTVTEIDSWAMAATPATLIYMNMDVRTRTTNYGQMATAGKFQYGQYNAAMVLDNLELICHGYYL